MSQAALDFRRHDFQFRPVMVTGSASKGDHTTSPHKCAQWCARRGRETAFADGGNISYKAEACSVSARRCRSKTTSNARSGLLDCTSRTAI
jgi:hypothetical protein